MKDVLQSFILNDDEYRGILVHLDECYEKILDLHAYPPLIGKLLGEVLTAVSLLGHQLKQEGRLALQLETEGVIQFCVAEINDRHGIRGLIQWRDNIPLHDNSDFFSTGKFVITLMPKDGDHYQGIVPLHADIAQSLERYFGQSEQIFSRILIACDEEKSAGLFIQKLPSEKEPSLDKNTLKLILDTVSKKEMLADSPETLLHKLFHDQKVQVFEPEKIHFECTCSHEKMENAVRLLTKEEAMDILKTHKSIEVTCEFCNHRYAFDVREVQEIFDKD